MPDHLPPVSALVFGLTTTADKIRALDRAGYSRSEIAKHLVIRYQQVRNVLEDDKKLGRKNHQAPSSRGMAEAEKSFVPPPQTARRVGVGPDGDVRIPQHILDAAGVKEGDDLLVRFEDNEIRLVTPAEAGRQARAIVRQYIPEGVNLVDELIAERRLEAKRETEDD